MIIQLRDALRDATFLLWHTVRAAWAQSMSEIEQGLLGWSNDTRWALNRVGMTRMEGNNANILIPSDDSKILVCTYYNENRCKKPSWGIQTLVCHLL